VLVLEVLGHAAEHAAVADLHARAERHAALEHGVVADLDATLQRHLGADHAEGADPHPGLEPRARIDDRRGMDRVTHRAPPSRPSFEDPETPTWATRIECSPTSTLCPIWTRLSILVPRRTMVSPKVARSIVVLAPISTSSSMTTPPVCGILRWRAPSKANPKPSAPMTAPGCTSTRRPSRAPASSVTCGPSTQPSPTSTSGPTYVSAPTRAPDPMRAPASITASGPTAAVASTRASAATTALASTPGSSGGAGWNSRS